MRILYGLTVTKFWSVILLVWFLFAGQNFAQKYGFETAIIHKSSRQVMSDVIIIEVTEKIYIISAGFKEAHHRTEKINNLMTNQIEESRSVTITDKDWIITYDPDTNEGTKMKNTFSDTFKGKSEEEIQKFGKDMADAMNTKVKEVGTEEVAGKLCTVTEAKTKMMGMETTTRTSIYKNFIMKMESEGPGTSSKEWVTEFQEGVWVDTTLFPVPSSVILRRIEMNNKWKQQFIPEIPDE